MLELNKKFFTPNYMNLLNSPLYRGVLYCYDGDKQHPLMPASCNNPPQLLSENPARKSYRTVLHLKACKIKIAYS